MPGFPEGFLRRKVYFGSRFQRFQSMATWMCCLGTAASQNIMARVHSRAYLFISWVARKRDEEKGLED
jgi:hypothetical protein